MRAGVGETAADGRSIAGGFGEVGRGVLEVRKLFLAITDVVSMLLEVWVPSMRALTAIQYRDRSPSASRKAPRYCAKLRYSMRRHRCS